MPDFSMEFTNASKTVFSYERGDYPADPVVDTINQSPAKELAKFSTETYSWSQAASSIVSYNDGSCYWNDSASGQWFGVKIHAPVQVFMIGTAPYYQVSYWTGNESTSKRDWFTPVNDPSTVYDFPSDVKWKIKIHPTAAHTTLQLAISISDK
ncbi:hypothetical protein CMEL01_11947 [Colletotrichum melonis]|uniref:Uncharacterized protein n=1 Tax=Colletotrichum melonis TaxID=1209925 RepID=A0AAI9Y088_9PEZI|nr:hypothetical protein CMEL01_11947 [Colletotrichum melonis]